MICRRRRVVLRAPRPVDSALERRGDVTAPVERPRSELAAARLPSARVRTTVRRAPTMPDRLVLARDEDGSDLAFIQIALRARPFCQRLQKVGRGVTCLRDEPMRVRSSQGSMRCRRTHTTCTETPGRAERRDSHETPRAGGDRRSGQTDAATRFFEMCAERSRRWCENHGGAASAFPEGGPVWCLRPLAPRSFLARGSGENMDARRVAVGEGAEVTWIAARRERPTTAERTDSDHPRSARRASRPLTALSVTRLRLPRTREEVLAPVKATSMSESGARVFEARRTRARVWGIDPRAQRGAPRDHAASHVSPRVHAVHPRRGGYRRGRAVQLFRVGDHTERGR